MSLHSGQKSSTTMSSALTNGLGLFSSNNNDDNKRQQQQQQQQHRERRNDNDDDDDYDEIDEPIVRLDSDIDVDDEDIGSVSSTHVNVNTDFDTARTNDRTNFQSSNLNRNRKKRRNKTEKEVFESSVYYNAAEHIEDTLHVTIDDSSTTSESFGTAGIVEIEENSSISNNNSHNTLRSVNAEEKKDDSVTTTTNTSTYHHPWKNEIVSSSTVTKTAFVDLNTSIDNCLDDNDDDDDDLILSSFGTPASGTIRHNRALSASLTNDTVEHHPWKSKKKNKHDFRTTTLRSHSYGNDTSAGTTSTDNTTMSSSPRRVRHAFSFPKDDDQYYNSISDNVVVVERTDNDTISKDNAVAAISTAIIPTSSTHSLGKINLSKTDNEEQEEEQDNNDYNHMEDNNDNNDNNSTCEDNSHAASSTMFKTPLTSMNSNPDSTKMTSLDHEHEHDPSSTTTESPTSSPVSPVSGTESIPVPDNSILIEAAATATTIVDSNDKDETCSSTQDLTDISEIFHSLQSRQSQSPMKQKQQSHSKEVVPVAAIDSREIWRTELANRVTATKNEMSNATTSGPEVVQVNYNDKDNNELLKLPKRTSDVEQEWQTLVQDANAVVNDDDVVADVIVANDETNHIGINDEDNDNDDELSISSQIQQSYSFKSSLSKSPSRSYNDIGISRSSSSCLSREDSYVRRIVKNVDEHGSPTPGLKKFIPSTAGEIIISEGIVQTIKHDVETTWAITKVPQYDKKGNLLIEIDEGHVKTITDDLLFKTTTTIHNQHNHNNNVDIDTTGHVKMVVDDVERRVIETTESLEEMQQQSMNNNSKSRLNYNHHHRHPSINSHNDNTNLLEEDNINTSEVTVESVALQQQQQQQPQNEKELTLVDSDEFETKYSHNDDDDNDNIDPPTDDNNSKTVVMGDNNDITVPDLTLDILVLDKEITANYKQQQDDVDHDVVVGVDDDNNTTTEETIPVLNQDLDPDTTSSTTRNVSCDKDLDNNNNTLEQPDTDDSANKKIPVLNQDPNNNIILPDPVDDPVVVSVPTINQDIDDTELTLDTVEETTKESESTSMGTNPVNEANQETLTELNLYSDNINLNPNPMENLSECTPQKQSINVDCVNLTLPFSKKDDDVVNVPEQPMNASNSFIHTDCDKIVTGFRTGDSEDFKKQQQNSTPKMKNTDGNNTNSTMITTTPESEGQSSSEMTVDRSNLPQIPADPLLVELKNYRRPAKLKTDSNIPDTVETASTPPNLPSKEVLLHTTPIPTVPTMTTYNTALAKDNTPNSVVSRSVSFEDALSVKSDIGSMVSNLSYPTYSAGSYVQVVTGTGGINFVNSPRYINTTAGSSVGTPRSTGSKTRKHISDMIRRDLWSKDQPTVEAALIELAEHAGSAAQHRHTIARSGGILAIVRAMEQNDSNSGIQIAACHALEKLALETDNELAIGEVGGVDAVLAAMMQHSTDVYVQEAAWSALWNLTCGNACDEMTTDTEGGMHAIVACMKQHVSHPEIQRNACGALANLCVYNDRRLHSLAEADGFVAIASALQSHWNNVTVRIEASNALTTLLEKCLTVSAFQQRQQQQQQQLQRTVMTNGESDVSDDEDLIHLTIKE